MDKKFIVVKRDGRKENFNPQKIKRVLEWATEDLSDVSIDEICNHFVFNYTSDGISTEQVHNSLIDSCLDLITEENPDYDFVAGRLLNYSLRKKVWGGVNPPRLLDLLKQNVKLGHYDDDILKKYTVKEINKINEFINHDRDFNFTYAGIKQLIDKYLVQNRKTGELFETPQFVYILVAMGLFSCEGEDRLSWVKRAYDHFSLFHINLATPVIAGVRTKLRSFASCALFDIGDSLNSIGAHDYLLKKASASRYGLGFNVSRIRPVGASIRHGDVLHTGLVPYLKNFESGIKSCHQNGLRNSSSTAFINWWHFQVEDVLVLKDNALPDEKAVRHLDYCLNFSDLFIERIKKNENITLFNPHEVPELIDNFGMSGWDEMYEKRESDEKISRKVIPARQLASLYAKHRLATARIYALNVDNVNRQSPFKERVGQSNLCVAPETELLTKDGIFDISTLENKEVEVWNGEQWSKTRVVKTGENQKLINISLEKEELDFDELNDLWVTEYHKFYLLDGREVRAKDLEIGDKLETFIDPVLVYDGDDGKRTFIVVGKKDKDRFGKERFDDTYCVSEPLRHRAVFNGVLTGNCMEVLHPTNPSEKWNDENGKIGVCILSAINALKVNDDNFEDVCEVIVRMLDNLIDYQVYFDIAAENFAKKYRSLGIGAYNFAAYLAENKIRYEDENAPQFAADFAEKLSYYTIKASIKLAKERGRCENFEKTKWADGLLPIDRYDKRIDSFISGPKLDWEELRKDLDENGIRHSTSVSYMPVESSSVISGGTSGLEPIRSYIVSRESKISSLTVVVPNLKKNKKYYTLAFDIRDTNVMAKIYAGINKYTCMSISANTYINTSHYEHKQVPLSVVLKDTLNFFDMGGKTQYYCNSEDGGGENYSEEESCPSGACKL